MRVPVSSQIYPPPVSIDAKLLPPLTDGQAHCKQGHRSEIAWRQWRQWRHVSTEILCEPVSSFHDTMRLLQMKTTDRHSMTSLIDIPHHSLILMTSQSSQHQADAMKKIQASAAIPPAQKMKCPCCGLLVAY